MLNVVCMGVRRYRSCKTIFASAFLVNSNDDAHARRSDSSPQISQSIEMTFGGANSAMRSIRLDFVDHVRKFG